MNASRLGRWLRTKSPLVTLLTVAPLVIVILGLTACVKHPIGDPEKSKVDPDFVGVWGVEGSILLFRPFDSRTYLISNFIFSQEDDELEAESRHDYKAWLTPVGDATFITMQPLSVAHFIGTAEKPPFFVAKIELVDGDLQLRLVDGTLAAIKDAQSSGELESAIKEHVSSDELYADEITVFEKIEDRARIESVLEAFPDDFTF